MKTMCVSFCRVINNCTKITVQKSLHGKLYFYTYFQLQDGNTLYDYDIKVNHVIQVLLRCETHDTTVNKEDINQTVDDNIENNCEHNKEFLEEDEYYCVGDFVDGLHPHVGAWFEAKIVRIAVDLQSLQHIYHVNFEKYSLGTDVPLELKHIRPQACIKISFDALFEGDLVLANFNNNSATERGYWHDCRIEKIIKEERKLYASVFMGDATLIKQRIKFIDEIYKIETNIKRDLRSQHDQQLIQFGSKSKRK